jgi:uncharacterized membrane protein YcaP (DUF421 family)
VSWDALWGSGEQLDVVQMSVRSAFYFFLLLVLVRIGGSRVFSRMSAFDNVVMIALGAVAARGIVGASPAAGTIAACAMIVFLHRLCARLAVGSWWIRRATEGRRVVLYRDGAIDPVALRRTALSEDELMATLRIETHADTLAGVEEAALETNGKISFVSKDRPDSRRSSAIRSASAASTR